jgi:hypothetical protein
MIPSMFHAAEAKYLSSPPQRPELPIPLKTRQKINQETLRIYCARFVKIEIAAFLSGTSAEPCTATFVSTNSLHLNHGLWPAGPDFSQTEVQT